MSELCITLTAEQAARDWGGSRKGTALRPVLLADGVTYVLPARALQRAAHAAHHEFLRPLTQRLVEVTEFPAAADGEARVSAPIKSK